MGRAPTRTRSQGRRPDEPTPYNDDVTAPRRRLAEVSRLVAAAFVVALVALPFAHHDLACHLKSNTHCTSCHVGTSADAAGGDPAASPVQFTDAGRPVEQPSSVIIGCGPLAKSGRAPPSTSGVLL